MRRRHPAGRELARLASRIRLVVFDFDGVFTDNTVLVSEDGREAVHCWRGDGVGLKALRQRGLDLLLVSTEANPVVSARAKKLGLPCLQDVSDKRAVLGRVMRERHLSPGQVAYVGNDVNDLECLAAVGLPIVVRDAHPSVLKMAKWRTRAAGGRGAVREVCDALAAVIQQENGGAAAWRKRGGRSSK